MEKNDIEKYLKKLKEIDNQLNDDENFNIETFTNLEKIINDLSTDIKKDDLTGDISMNVNFTKLNKLAISPSYAKDGDAGLDFRVSRIVYDNEKQICYGTDISMEIPRGYVGLIFPRSSVRDTDLILSNCVGVIDSGYRGEIMATFNKKEGLMSYTYNIGDKMCQMIIIPYPKIKLIEKENLSETERGTGGHGHSGK
jgi:dUTP pyrophosphatase